MNDNGNRLPIVEALIFSSPEPLPTSKIINIIQDITAGEIDKIVNELNEKYMMNDASYRIRKIASGYQIYITENYAGYVEELFTRRRVQKLTRAALETVAIIAYRQPVTRVDIEMIRGVSSDSAIRTLLERKFITLSGRAKTIGRPLLYSTTDEFLKYFGLNSLNDLPKMEEIEELLSAREPESQQTLAFESSNKNDLGDEISDEENESIEQQVTDVSDEKIEAEDNTGRSDTDEAFQVEFDSEKIEESASSTVQIPEQSEKKFDLSEEEDNEEEKEFVNITSEAEEF